MINKIVRYALSGFAALYLLSTATTYASTSDPGSFNLTEVATDLYVHFGKHVAIDHSESDDIANIGFIIGERCIAVIDTGGSIDIGKKLLGQIRNISKKPICYVINTHIHFDHILGNQAFAAAAPVFVGHHRLAAAVERNRDFFLDQFSENLAGKTDKKAIIGPSLLIDKTRQLDLGQRIITLIPTPVAHSYNDLLVLDEKTKTLWSGDLIFRERTPIITGSLRGWIETMQNILSLQIKAVIPGHGSLADSLETALKKQQEYFQLLLDQTRQAIATGKFANDAIKDIDSDNRWGWLLFEQQHPANVSRVFTELEWE